jgi:hypothetical protein
MVCMLHNFNGNESYEKEIKRNEEYALKLYEGCEKQSAYATKYIIQ